MRKLRYRITPLLMVLGLLLSLAGCRTFSLSEEELTELEEDEAQVVVGQSTVQTIGQELAATYAADHIFSLNCVSDTTYNPFLTSSAWNKVVGMLVYETLVEQDEGFSAQPNLITSWKTEDGLTWTFTVDTTRTFHDGGRMTSLDAAYSLQLAMNYEGAYNTRFRHVQDVYWDGEEVLNVVLRTPDYQFYQLMNIPCVEYETGFQDRPPGTGPYKFSASGRYLTLVKDHPLADRMPLETIHLKEYSAAVDILQAFEDSYIDLVINDPNGMSSLGYSNTNIIKYVNTSSMHYLAYNLSSPVFSQMPYRQLLTYAVDRNSIVTELMKGAATAAAVPVAPQTELYPEELAESLGYSESLLAVAMAQAGVQDLDGDGVLELAGAPYVIDFVVCAESGTKVAAARNIAKKLQDAGFGVELRELGYEDYTEALKKGEFDIYYAEVRLCADWDLTLLLGSGGSLNFGGVRDAALDELLSRFLATDGQAHAQAAQELYQHIGQNAYLTPICFEKSEVLYHRGVLSGLNPTQDNIFHGMENWEVNITDLQ